MDEQLMGILSMLGVGNPNFNQNKGVAGYYNPSSTDTKEDYTSKLLKALMPAAPKLVLGGYQAVKGYMSDEPKRPEMKVPGSVLTATKNAQDQASNVLLPGQSAIEGNIDQQTANMLQNIERMGGDVNMASRLYGQNLGAKTNLGISAAQNYNQNQARLREQLNRQGEYERRNFDYNEAMPYQEKMRALSALKGAGLTNTTESLTDMLKSYGIMSMLKPKDLTSKKITQQGSTPYSGGESLNYGELYNPNTGSDFIAQDGSLMDALNITPFN